MICRNYKKKSRPGRKRYMKEYPWTVSVSLRFNNFAPLNKLLLPKNIWDKRFLSTHKILSPDLDMSHPNWDLFAQSYKEPSSISKICYKIERKLHFKLNLSYLKLIQIIERYLVLPFHTSLLQSKGTWARCHSLPVGGLPLHSTSTKSLVS